jgi:outer membrane scaffolding protein for murein synthesis (MipA/OmpV family)
LALFLLTLGVLPGRAFAQTPSPLNEWQYSSGISLRTLYEKPMPDWDISVGAAVETQNDYDGSNSYDVQGGPVFDIRYRDIAFLSSGEGLGVNVFRGKTYRVGIALTYDLGRDKEDEAHLSGLGGIRPAVEPKLFGEYNIIVPKLSLPIVLRLEARRGFGGNSGWIGDFSAYMPVIGTKKFFVFVGPSVTAADATWMHRYFGVTPQQSAASGLPVYSPGSGIKSIGFGASAVWFVSKHWFGTADGSVEDLLGDAAKSPITLANVQTVLSLSVGYQF